MDQPLKKWYCDNCGNRLNAEEGYAVWKTDDDHKAHSFRIIHNSKCDTDKSFSYVALSKFLGENGLSYLLSKLSLGKLKLLINKETFTQISKFDEFVDFFRRLQTPYYEEARLHFQSETTQEKHYDSDECLPYFPEQLKKIIQQNEN